MTNNPDYEKEYEIKNGGTITIQLFNIEPEFLEGCKGDKITPPTDDDWYLGDFDFKVFFIHDSMEEEIEIIDGALGWVEIKIDRDDVLKKMIPKWIKRGNTI